MLFLGRVAEAIASEPHGSVGPSLDPRIAAGWEAEAREPIGVGVGARANSAMFGGRSYVNVQFLAPGVPIGGPTG